MKLLLLVLLQFSPTLGFGAVQNFCNGNFTGQTPLPLELKKAFDGSYKITTVLTDWVNNSTHAVVEIAHQNRNSTTVKDGNGLDVHYIADQGRIVVVNNSANTCVVQNEYKPFQLNSSILQKIGASGSYISELVNMIVDKKYNGFMQGSQIVAGVEAIKWVTCVNGSDGQPNLQVEAVYSGTGSLSPTSGSFKNPLMYFFRLSEFSPPNSTDPVNSFSFQIESYNEVDDNSVFDIPQAKVCTGWPTSKLSVAFPEPFSGLVTYKNGDSVSTAKVYYSSTMDTTAVCLDSLKSGDQIPFFNTKAQSDGVMSVIHDFKTGYEYSLAASRCAYLAPIPDDSADVIKTPAFTIRSLAEHFVNESLSWGQYGNVSHLNGDALSIWRTMEGDNVIEAHIGKSQWSFAKYNKDGLVSFTEVIVAPLPPITVAVERSRECFAENSSGNNTFTFNIKGKKMSDVFSVGESQIVSSLANALAKVALINPLRVSALFSALPNEDIGVFLTVADKNTKAPANTGKFNYSAEVSTEELFNALNKTFAAEDWQFDVTTLDMKTEIWLARVATLSRYPLQPAPQPAPYQGYTGGSMFVLGIFSLILGCAIGAGGLFFITKKQRISTLAYQVFE